MPSVTYWSPLEPRPRSLSIAELAAKVRDPLWMLTRQWQVGELHGEDAASPAFGQLSVRLGHLSTWSTDDADAQSLPASAPLEAVALAEDFTPKDLSLALELGQVFETALVEANRVDLVSLFRQTYPFRPDQELDARDLDARRFLEVIAERGTNGIDLFLAAEGADLPAEPVIGAVDEDPVRKALERLRAWVRDTIGRIGENDAASWKPEELEYNLKLRGVAPGGGEVVLAAHPGLDGRSEWYAFDIQTEDTSAGGSERDLVQILRSVIPANVSFRGMPNARWWAFETGGTNFGAVRPEKRELAKIIVLDFMLVHSNDWYVIPFRQPLSTICRIESLVIHDVFGGMTLIERADHGPDLGSVPWTMFSNSVAGSNRIGDLFLIPPTTGSTVQSGEPLEVVRFLRDEMANMAWGVERVVSNRIGEPWPAAERSLSGPASAELPASEPGADEVPLRYHIQTPVPEHWIPLLPVLIDASVRSVQLERGVILQSASEDAKPPQPAGRILQPTRLQGNPYRLDEQEVPRTSVQLARLINRCRWTDGSTHIWIARRKTLAAREEPSGLMFDVAVRRSSSGSR